MSIQYQPLSGSLLDDHNFPEMMRKVESHVGVVYDDGKHIATIGIGTNIKEVKAYLALALKELGVFQPVAGETDAQRNARYGAIIQGFQNVIASHPLDRRGNQSPGMSDSEIALQNALNAELNKYLPGQRFELSEIQSKNIVRQIALGFEIAADTNPADGAANGAFLKTTGIVIALDQRLATDGYGVVLNHNTREYQALLSLQFNTKAGATNLIGNNLRQALKDGNRAEAWYEIRYNSNGDVLDGIAKRRYYEAEIFGLYDSPGSTTDTEAKSVLQMYTRHRTAIIKYEATYSLQIAAAKSDYGLSGSGEVDTLAQALSLARTRLIATEVTGRGITSVIDGEVLIGQDSDFTSRVKGVPKTWYKNDILTGTDKNDLILGGEGADRLEGGKGDDVLVGGNGLDVYVVDGNDLITAAVAEGVQLLNIGNPDIPGLTADIVWADARSGFGLSTGLTYDSAGNLDLGHGSVPLAPYGGASALGGGWSFSMDFGGGSWSIAYTHPSLAPGGKTPTGVWEHFIVPVSLTEGVFLFGEAGDDLIVGNDGADYLDGGSGKDQLFGHAGNDVLDGGTEEDTLAGGDGQDILLGGDQNDTLYGEQQDDVLIGGSGDDVLWGDSPNAPSVRWHYSICKQNQSQNHRLNRVYN